MRNVHGLRCLHCNRPIAARESHWEWHLGGGAGVSVIGAECLIYLDGPEIAGLLDYAERYGLGAARDLLVRQRRTGVQAERSEP